VNFFRHELDGRIGLERSFRIGADYSLHLSAAVRGNLFFPDDDQRVRVDSVREATSALILQQSAYLDLRDDPRDPHAGAFFAVDLQEGGFGGITSWDYIRLTAEARGYIPLPAGIVIAARVGIGMMEVLTAYGLSPDNVYQLAFLGPFSEQLSGGGANSNRGFPAGYLGDIERREIAVRPLPDGTEGAHPPVLISGGVRRWEFTLELRIPITPEIGVVLFADAGDLTRRTDFRLDHPQISPGLGLRIRTFIGTFRLDFAFRPDAIQVLGTDSRPTACAPHGGGTVREGCRPVPMVGDNWYPGAIHLTIGEAF
jgi:outer membrane protein assembly factor BamA